ncbi:unnamed protein product [Penicillium nalgiovense]|nr:unnamed protein product [Penicillium nalgiovense]CAG8071685.1 unnamed protein product [Penicillium nalgiovense]CAG8131113.1 unnamed protein product [Penicillium nalgiovense]
MGCLPWPMLVPTPSHSQAAPSPSTAGSDADHFKSYTIKAENLVAKLIPYGAHVVVGCDDLKEYLHDSQTNRTFFGAVVGRYANRIKNSTFTIDDNEYHVPENENGADTLHGGFTGYDIEHSDSSITFTLLNRDFEKFPGDVVTHATFSVSTEKTQSNPKGLSQLTAKLVALSLTEKTPTMLSNHIYWNLNAFKESNVSPGLHQPQLIGKDIEKTYNLCGTGCTGYGTCFLVDRSSTYASDSMVTVLSAESSPTGISLDVATNQAALQIYTCSGQNGSVATKKSQYGCFVIETEDWIYFINNPEWGHLPYQVFGPDDGPAVNWATYQFGTI